MRFISKEEAAKIMGVSSMTLNKFCESGEISTTLEPKKPGQKGRRRTLVNLDDVQKLKASTPERVEAPKESIITSSYERYSPEEAARVFDSLKRNVSLEDCVVNLQIHPRAVMAIARVWDEIRGSVTLTSKQLGEIEKMGLDGVFPITTPEGLMEILEEASRSRNCFCGGKAVKCKACVQKISQEAVNVASSERLVEGKELPSD